MRVLLRLIAPLLNSGLVSHAFVLVGQWLGQARRQGLLARLGMLSKEHVRFVAAVEAQSASLPALKSLERVDLTPEEFFHRFASKGLPVVLTGATRSWPVFDWTLPRMKAQLGHVRIRARKGRDYDQMQVVQLSLAEYIDALSSDTPYYMANQPVPPPLMEAIGLPPYFPRERFMAQPGPRLWLGPAGSGTHLHRDLTDNFLVQLLGQKKLYLCPPHDSAHVYAWEVHDGLHSCKADLGARDLKKFPRLEKASPLEVVLIPGEMLYIPCGWFHQIHNPGITCSVNFFVSNSTAAIPEWDKQWPPRLVAGAR